MPDVTIVDIENALKNLGISRGDIVIFHSSLKSFGNVLGGADTVIDAFLNAVSDEGTIVVPTLCQNDWDNVYKNWHIDAPSDVGYITNVFRKRENAFRSNQGTHSVAAIGKDALYITETHGESGKRIGVFGDTPFSADSPWEKLYKVNAKIVFIGVSMMYCTMRHYAEYVFVDRCLKASKHSSRYEEILNELWVYGKKGGVWPFLEDVVVENCLKENNKVKSEKCGNAILMCVDAKDYVDLSIAFLEEANEKALKGNVEKLNWIRKVIAASDRV